VVLVGGGEHLTRFLVYLDAKGLDGAVNSIAALVGGVSGRARKLQNGYVRSYALSMFGGALVLVATTLLMRSM
jgi:NADH-quinone oxidoreductase subunit L